MLTVLLSRVSSCCVLFLIGFFGVLQVEAAGQAVVTGDSRTVTEPVFPSVCTVLKAVQTAGSLVETSPDTTRVQAALNACPVGQAVEFSAAGTANAFIIAPITLPAGVTMLVDPQVTIFGSITSTDYACAGSWCTSLISVADNTTQPGSGIMGYGVIDGRGGVKLTNTGAAWWDDASKPRPRTVFLADHNDATVSSDYFTLYKITIQNSPKFEFSGIGNNLTIWGVKILAPPDSPNTDGIDPSSSSNITITNSFVSTGDDMIAFKAGNGHVSNATVSNNHMYSGHGITVGSETNAGLNNMLVIGDAIDNGFGGSSLDSLRIKSDVSRGGEVKDVMYKNICINNGGDTIVLDPYYSNETGTLIPNFHDIHFDHVHKLIHNSSYKSTFNGYNTSGTVNPLIVTLSNVYFDGDTQNDFKAPKQVNNAQFTLGPDPVSFASFLVVDAATASNYVTVVNNITTTNPALDCSKAFIYIAGELTGPASPVAVGSSPIVTAVVQNVVSPPTAGGTVAKQQNTPTGTVQLLEGTTVVGTATISGRLAYITINKITAGTHTYTGNYMGDTNFSATPFGTFVITASASGSAGTSTITGGATTVTYGTATATLSASIAYTGTAAPTGAVSFTVAGAAYPATCTSAAGTRTCTATFNSSTTAAGTYAVSITEAADAMYTAANGTGSLIVSRATPNITFTVPDHKSTDAPFPVTATSNSTGVFVYTVISGPATISGNTVTLTGTGVVTLQAAEAADTNYVAGSKQVTFNVTSTALTAPTITFNVPAHTYGDSPFTVTATSNSTGAITYSVTSGPATINGSTVTLTGAGTVVLLASQAATATYSAGTKTASVAVAQATPTIAFTVPNHTSTDAAFPVAATSSSTGAFTYTVLSGPATISGNTVTLTGAGTVVLQASEVADTNYAAATKQATFTVTAGTKPNPTITFVVPNHVSSDAPFMVAATSNSTGAFTYSVVSGPAMIAGNMVTLTGSGPVVLLASEAADANYATGTQSASFTVTAATKPNPTIVFNVGSHTTADAPFQVAATSNSTGAFTYSVLSGPATIAGSTVTLTGAGTVVLQASEAADTKYATSTQTASFTVTSATKPSPTIAFTVPSHIYGDAPFAIAATSNSTGAFTYSVVSGPATISGSTVTLTGAGSVVLQASEVADATYAAGTKPASFTVSPAVLTAAATNATRVYGTTNPTFTGTVTGQKNGDTFTEAFSTTATATSPAGTYTIVPTAAGANLANYTVSATNGTLTITKATATLGLVAISNSGQSATLNVTAVSMTSGTPTGTVTILDNGTPIGTATLINGTATYTATVPTGSNSVTATYSGDVNFQSSISTTPPVVVGSSTGTDFTFASSSANSVAVLGGQTAIFTFAVTPVGGAYPNPVNFTVTGLPTGAVATFSPSTITTSAGAQTVVLSIQTQTMHAANTLPTHESSGNTTWLALLLLPVLGGGYRFRRKLGQRVSILLLLLVGLAGATALTGCTGGFEHPNIATLNVSATSGTITHSQTVTLVVQ